MIATGFDRVDAMKVDIEGFEDRDLCVARGYRVCMEEPGMNTIFELDA